MSGQNELLIPGKDSQVEERSLNENNLQTLVEAGLPFGETSTERLIGAQLALTWLHRDRSEEDPYIKQLTGGLDLVRLNIAVNLAIAQILREEQVGDGDTELEQ